MDIKRDFLKETWHEFNKEVSFKVRAFPFSSHKALDPVEMATEQFVYCLVDWKGLNEDGKKMPVNDDNKRYLFDYYQDVRDFVIGKSGAFAKGLGEELKN